jgi:hypothetical protein
MKTNMIRLTFVTALILALSGAGTAFAQEAPPLTLNGQSFKIELVDAQNNVTYDVLDFKETSFTCNAIANSTYTGTRYTVQPQADGKLALYAVAISQTEGTISYKGQLSDGKLEGGMLIEKPGAEVVKHRFTGTSRVNTSPSK